MKDSQVDLCGEIGRAEEDDFPVLAKTDSFAFACNGCGDCCRGREDIVLSGYDLWRICARLRLPPQIVLRAFCRSYVGQNSLLPVVRLQPLRAEKDNCPFLSGGRCSIHDAEPLVCALFPLGQQIGLDGTVTYFAQPVDCGGRPQSAVVGDYLARYGIESREAVDAQWALCCIGLSHRVRALAKTAGDIQLKLLQRRICRGLYLDYDFAVPYEPQFAAQRRKLETLLDGLEKQYGTADTVRNMPQNG